jgi:predicted  nucleic acid-binding Zn-ribbon protein
MESRSNSFRARAAVALVAMIGAGGAVVAAGASGQTVGELNSKLAAAHAQADQLGAAIQARTQELAAARQQAAAAAAREAQLTSLLAVGEQRAAELQTKVDSAQGRLDRRRTQLRGALRTLSARLVAIYEGNSPDPVEVLLSAHGFDDLATRAALLRRIQRSDDELASRVRTLKGEVAAELAAVQTAHAQAVAYNQRLAAARSQIDAVRARAESQAAALDAARQSEQGALASLQAQVQTWQREVEQAQQVSAAQAQQTVTSWVGKWAIPAYIVMCESGGNFRAVNPSSGAGGAYQILPSTWRLYGGTGLPEDASPAEQSRIAAQIWADSGSGAWQCASR